MENSNEQKNDTSSPAEDKAFKEMEKENNNYRQLTAEDKAFIAKFPDDINKILY